MTVAALPGISGISGLAPIAQPQAPTAPSGAGFGNVLTNAIDGLVSTQSTADSAAIKAVTSGDLTDIHQATLAATRAQVTMELVSAVRNKGVDAFNQIMNMQA
ncbi:MAG: flagellar hook-basal body complex protein FliE [Microbacteriaceae bacterium]|jgi:flagellar hook-basal body complex protein FliE|nr:flagellar hook-basal body complex protein FliE [Microbacteriaceae bacterium]